MPGTPRQTFRLDELIWEKFQKKCADKGFTASDVLRGFIKQIVTGAMSVESVHPSRTQRGQALRMTDEAKLEWFRRDPHRVRQ